MGPRGGAQGGRPAPTYLDFIRPDLEGLDDAGQEAFHLLEVTVADAPGPVHQEDQVRGGGGRAAEWGAGWAAGRAGLWVRPPPLQGPRLLQPWSPSLGLVDGEGPRGSGRKEAGSEFGDRDSRGARVSAEPEYPTWTSVPGLSPSEPPKRANKAPRGPCASVFQQPWQVQSLRGCGGHHAEPLPLAGQPIPRLSGQRLPRWCRPGWAGSAPRTAPRALPWAQALPGLGSSLETKPRPDRVWGSLRSIRTAPQAQARARARPARRLLGGQVQ